MCRLCSVTYGSCHHLHHFQPLETCEAGFEFGNPGKCLAKPLRAVNIIQTVRLGNRPRCAACLEKDLREEYGERELWLMDRAFTRSQGGGSAVNAKLQELRAEMAEDIEDMKAKYEDDWRTNEETTWTDGYQSLIWNPRSKEVVIQERSRRWKTSGPDMTETKGSAMQYFLKDLTDVDYEPMDMSIPGTKFDQ